MSFECPRGLVHETGTWREAKDGAIILPQEWRARPRVPVPDKKRNLFQQPDDSGESAALLPSAASQEKFVTSLEAMWGTIMLKYSARSQTKKTDKLPALSGLARHFEDLGLGDYLVGDG